MGETLIGADEGSRLTSRGGKWEKRLEGAAIEVIACVSVPAHGQPNPVAFIFCTVHVIK